jgi:streptogramin lyase
LSARRRTTATIVAGLLLATVLSIGATGTPAGAATGDVTIVADSDDVGSPEGIVDGPDGNVWFADSIGRQIGRITPDGVVTTFPTPGTDVEPVEITVGPDGNLWFTSSEGIGRSTTAGAITLFELDATSRGLTAGPDGNLWFTTLTQIGRITPSGTVTYFSDPENPVSAPRGITTGPDGNLWFTSSNSDRIGRITPGGTITTFTDSSGNLDDPRQIVSGPDGRLWVTSMGSNRIARVTTAGAISSFSTGGLDEPEAITVGPDGNVWFTADEETVVARISGPFNDITTFPTTSGIATRITGGPDGDIWFTMDTSDEIARLELCSPAQATDVTAAHPFFADICWMVLEGISTGYEDGSFRPSAPVTRQAMSAFMYRLADQPTFSPPAEPSFADVGLSHPFFAEIEWLASTGVSTGYPGSPLPTYQPSAAVSRQAMSAFLYRLAGSPTVGVTPPTFTDVGPSHPFFDEIQWMAAKDVSTGYQPGPTYRPDLPVSRQAMSAFMHRFGETLVVDV